MEDAKEQVRQGKAWAAVYLGPDFTFDLLKRVCNVSHCPRNASIPPPDNTTANGSAVHLYTDLTGTVS